MAGPAAGISVTILDDATSETIAAGIIPAADLPETFELETTLHLGDGDWSVIHAEPSTKAEFMNSGKLTVRVRKVEKIDLSELLYSLPSICDRLPDVSDAATSGDEFILVEDDWRQFELVSRAFADDADAEIAAIRGIHEDERAGFGWRKIHVRKRPDPPIASALRREDVDQAFGGLAFRSLRIGGSPVVAGFSFRAGGLECYGVDEDGAVSVLGVAGGAAREGAVEALAEIARRFDLDLIHWCRCVRVGWDDPLFRQLLMAEA